jgi:23S rRNA (cytidine1920-2'-O)/16S rRNA (cytidine1409-2'-O)-methyltransferase
MERVNARNLVPEYLPQRCRLAVVDVSFISLAKVVPALLPLLEDGGLLLPMIKPQFVAGRGAVGKGGILRDPEVRRRVVDETVRRLADLGLELVGCVDSEVPGMGGNLESFALFAKPAVEPVAAGAGSRRGEVGR